MARSVASIPVLGQKNLLDIFHYKTHFSSVFIFHMLMIEKYQNLSVWYSSQLFSSIFQKEVQWTSFSNILINSCNENFCFMLNCVIRCSICCAKIMQLLLLFTAGPVCCSGSSLGSCSIAYYLYDAKFPGLEKGTCIIDFNGIWQQWYTRMLHIQMGQR